MTLDLATSRPREIWPVPHLVTGANLRKAVEDKTFIRRGEVASVEGVKIDLHMSPRILKAVYRQPINIEELPAAERSNLAVDPGEVVFVLTNEILKLPHTMMAVLSPKRSLTHSGIIVLGGFAIDPNYFGVLWFGLYNLSSTSFPISSGKKLIAAMFYDLESSESIAPPTVEPECIVDFPDELITLIKNYKPADLKAIQDELRETRQEPALLKSDLISDREWRDEFKRDLQANNAQIQANNAQIDKILGGYLVGSIRRRSCGKRLMLASTLNWMR